MPCANLGQFRLSEGILECLILSVQPCPGRFPRKAGNTGAKDKLHSPAMAGAERGVRVNSQVPVAVEWNSGGELLRGEAQTRVVGPYGHA